MDVVVTGSTGLIGEAVVSALDDAGHRAIRAVRHSAPDDRPSLRWLPEHGEIEAAAFEGVDAVIHLAGAGIADKRWSKDRKRVLVESRTIGTALLAETLAGLANPPRVLISGSAIGYYGDRADEVLTEASEPGTGFLADLCVAWERSTAAAEAADIRVAHMRTGIVLSDRGGALAEQLPFFRLGLGGRIGAGTQYWSWISLRDQVRAILWLLDHPVAGAVNLTGPNPVTQAELAKRLGAVLRRPTLIPTPKLALYARLGKQQTQELTLASARVLPEALAASGFEFSDPTIDEALRSALGRD